MDFLSATIYGLIQGLCEFLPVSSSGHLAILPRMMHVSDPGVFFDLLMHVGTAVAVCAYYRKKIAQLLQSFLKLSQTFLRERRLKAETETDFLLINMILTTISSVIVIVLIKHYAEAQERNYVMIGFNLIIFGFILWIIDKIVKITNDQHFETKIDYTASILVGVAQAFAIFPGVSRSGITLTMSRGLGISKRSAANFTFLLSVPLIFAGAATKTLEVVKHGAPMPSVPIMLYATTLSALVGWITIHYFIKLIQHIPLVYFFLYRLALGLLVWKICT